MGIISSLHLTNETSRIMKASFLAMFGLLALANAAPQYGYSNNFSGSKKPLTGSYSNCNVEWRTVKKAGYEEKTEYIEKTVYVNVCKDVYQTECKKVKVPKEVYVNECNNKKWQPTGEDCKKIYVDNCKDVPKTIYEWKVQCDKKKVKKCEDVPKIEEVEIHKRVPVQIEGSIAYRVCPGQSDHEYTPTEV